MQLQSIWQQGSSNPDNADNLGTIRDWWQELNGKEIFWQQRLIPQDGELGKINWEKARFDEEFLIVNPQLRGITLYWQKLDSEQERNTTPTQLILDSLHQLLYIFPQSQPGLVIRVGVPVITYQTIAVTNPQWEYRTTGESCQLSLRDDSQQIEVSVTLSPENLKQLMRELLKQDKV